MTGKLYQARLNGALIQPGTVTTTQILDGTITDADIAAAAAIAQSKIATPRAAVYHNTTQSLASGAFVDMVFNSENFDTDTIHDTVTNNSRLTCKTAGVYFVFATVVFGINATGTRWVNFAVNGGGGWYDNQNAVGGGNQTMICVAGLYQLAVNDYVTVQPYQDSGTALLLSAGASNSPQFGMVQVA